MPNYDVYFEVTEKKFYRIPISADDHKEAFIKADEQLVNAGGVPANAVEITNQFEVNVEISYVEPIEEEPIDR
jgi:hypothetical protein